MINKLTLKNFKKHRELELAFVEGLNVIRAANEQGKSTAYHAIAYALWGSRALPESLEETVTWGEPASSLKVILEFTHAGVGYKITRSKSGAELEGGGSVASGQAEVSAFVERLLGANYQVGLATLIAGQSSLQNGLDGEAVSLIEKLSNMGVIDEYVTKIQDTLPSGNTRALEQNLAELTEGLKEKPEADFSTQEIDVQAAKARLESTKSALEKATSLYADKKSAAEEANSRIQLQSANERESARLKVTIKELELAASVKVPDKPHGEIENLLRLQRQQAEDANTRRAFAAFQNASLPADSGMTREQFEEAYKAAGSRLAALENQRNSELLKKVELSAKIITETHCGLCEKDLSAVPEVQEKNERLYREISLAEERLADLVLQIESAQQALKELVQLASEDKRVRASVKQLQFVGLYEGVFPATCVWQGPSVGSEIDNTDYAKAIKELTAANSLYEKQMNTRAASQEALEKAQERLKALEVPVALPEDKDTVVALNRLNQTVSDLRVSVSEAASALREAETALDVAKKQHDSRLEMYQQAVAQKQQLQVLLDSTNLHNRVIRKLREARPVVAKELWSMVLAGVSQIFSQIRGVQSVVARGKSGFTIDGKPMSAYSGSTKDSLGLACRVMLQKTFMGNTDFMLLDEPAAACDETREVDMLAAITRAEYKQVILVTHSERADTFASNVIRL